MSVSGRTTTVSSDEPPAPTGLIKTAPAGNSSPSVSRRICNSARTNPPPAESPAMMIWSGLIGRCLASAGGRVRYRYAARQSCIAHGKGYWGASACVVRADIIALGESLTAVINGKAPSTHLASVAPNGVPVGVDRTPVIRAAVYYMGELGQGGVGWCGGNVGFGTNCTAYTSSRPSHFGLIVSTRYQILGMGTTYSTLPVENLALSYPLLQGTFRVCWLLMDPYVAAFLACSKYRRPSWPLPCRHP